MRPIFSNEATYMINIPTLGKSGACLDVLPALASAPESDVSSFEAFRIASLTAGMSKTKLAVATKSSQK